MEAVGGGDGVVDAGYVSYHTRRSPHTPPSTQIVPAASPPYRYTLPAVCCPTTLSPQRATTASLNGQPPQPNQSEPWPSTSSARSTHRLGKSTALNAMVRVPKLLRAHLRRTARSWYFRCTTHHDRTHDHLCSLRAVPETTPETSDMSGRTGGGA